METETVRGKSLDAEQVADYFESYLFDLSIRGNEANFHNDTDSLVFIQAHYESVRRLRNRILGMAK